MGRSYQIKLGSELVGFVDILGSMVLWTGPTKVDAKKDAIGCPIDLSTECKSQILDAIRQKDKARIIPVGKYRAIALK